MDLQQLRYVVAVAAEGTFTAAARRLGVTQPSLSSGVAALERELKCKLFVRSVRGAELSPVGHAFVAEAEAVLVRLDQAVANVQEATRSGRLGLRLGFVSWFDEAAIEELTRRLEARSARLTISGVTGTAWDLVSQVMQGTIDAAVVVKPAAIDDLRVVDLVAEPLVVALPSAHEFAVSEQLTLQDLASVQVEVVGRKDHPFLHDRLCAYLDRAGIRAIDSGCRHWAGELSLRVAAGAVSIVPAHVAAYNHSRRITFRSMTPTAPVVKYVLVRRHRDSKPWDDVLDAVAQEMHNMPSWPEPESDG